MRYASVLLGVLLGIIITPDHVQAGPKPALITMVQPNYTYRAIRDGIRGKVMARVTTRKDGTVSAVKIKKGLRDGLNEATIKAIKQWLFSGAGTVDVEVEFHLKTIG